MKSNQIQAVLATNLSPADGHAYDAFVARALGGHYSQTRRWAKLAETARPATPYFFLAWRDNAVVAAALLWRPRLVGFLPAPFAYVERGPVWNDWTDLDVVMSSLLGRTRDLGILRLSIMPFWSGGAVPLIEKSLGHHGFRDVQSFAGRHVRSLRVDLTDAASVGFETSVFVTLRAKLRRAQRAGVIVRQARQDDIPVFRNLHKQMQRREGHRGPRPLWYQALGEILIEPATPAAMFVCEYQGQMLSAVLVVCHNAIATYVVGATAAGPLSFSKMVCAMAEAIQWSAAAGMTTFDLGGIPMSGDSDTRRLNIARFKAMFSTTTIDYVHEMARWF